MNRLLVGKMISKNIVWNKEEPYDFRKNRCLEIDIYYVNDSNYLLENWLYQDDCDIIGLPKLKQINVFKTGQEILDFIVRRKNGETDFITKNVFSYEKNLCYELQSFNKIHFENNIFGML